MKTKENASELIRDEISKFPTLRLPQAKPSDIFPSLEEQGIAITPSVRTMTSKLLSAAKRQVPATRFGSDYEGVSNEQVMAAISFTKACGGLKNAKKAMECLEGIMDLFNT
jgi:uncharacterized protein (DUF433 family)